MHPQATSVAHTWARLRCYRRPPTRMGWLTMIKPPSSVRTFSSTAATAEYLTRARPSILRVSDEVDAALATNRPVVALETTIYTHGAFDEDLRLEEIVREHGAVPAVVGVIDGRPCVGLSPVEIARMVAEGAEKVSRRDLARITAAGGVRAGDTGRKHGGTTVSGTMVLARQAGIRVFGTGGLGGVHRGWSSHMDISADLSELGRTRMAVVSSGCKGFLDMAATLEYLETQGVYVGTFGPPGTPFPAFWSRDSSLASPAVVADEAAAAAIVWAQEQLNIETGMLFANPIPAGAAVPRAEMEAVIDQATIEAAAQGFTGSRNTPFVLQRIRELTEDRSVAANLTLVQDNVARAAKIAVHLSALAGEDVSTFMPPPSTATALPAAGSHADILVAGSVALDLGCDYLGGSKGPTPQPHTSNPATIVPSVGGVGHNVTLAAHRISPKTTVRLCSLVGDDVAGTTVLATMQTNGLDTVAVTARKNARTAHYVAVNDADKNLVLAMADMALFDAAPAGQDVNVDAIVAAARPRWLVIDANWNSAGVRAWTDAGRTHGARIALEPVSVAKAGRLLGPTSSSVSTSASSLPLPVFPTPLADLAAPNRLELAALHDAARARPGTLVDDPHWFRVIDALGLGASSRIRNRFVRASSPALTDAGVPVQAVQLLPYIPVLATKLGPEGVLLTMLLHRDDPLLHDPAADAHIVVRAPPPQIALAQELYGDGGVTTEHAVGGVYMRLFPPPFANGHIVSVNGAGDTLLGALVAGLAQGGRIEHLIDTAQQAAMQTLRSPQAVAPSLDTLAETLSAAVAQSKPMLSR